jgi:osmoprotectant transport system permease protein
MSFLQAVAGWFADPAHWSGDGGVPHRLAEHLTFSAVATVVAMLIALPIGIALGHYGKLGNAAINVSNVGRAIPSFAILVLAFQVFGLGSYPAYIALILLAIPPMLTNSYIGVRDVDPEARDAARGMGMRGRRILRDVELPLALPLIMAGIRTSAVQVVATATLAAIIAGGGLGRYIIDGLAQQKQETVFAGAVLVAGLAILVELGLSGVEQLVTPRGLRMKVAPATPAEEPASAKAA